MTQSQVQTLVADATYHFTLGNDDLALQTLERAIELDNHNFDAWLAVTEILYAQKDFQGAAEAAEITYKLNPDDIHINTSLSRIWVQLADKDKAEYFGAKARMLNWQHQMQNPQEEEEIQAN